MRMRWTRALLIWVVLMLVESLHGILRQLVLAPMIGDGSARRVGVLSGLVLIFLTTLLSIRWIGAKRTRDLLLVGVLWAALTMTFEIALGRLVLGYEWERVTSDYDLSKGGFMALGLLCMIFVPLAAAAVRDR